LREEHPIPGADRFLERLREREASSLVLTNNEMYTPRDLAARLSPEVPGAAEAGGTRAARFTPERRAAKL
jgi:ribonucleotide monophosphatase NagD (HAD superfamily)